MPLDGGIRSRKAARVIPKPAPGAMFRDQPTAPKGVHYPFS